MLQPLDCGINALFKVQNKKELLEWVLSHFDSSTTHQALRKIMPNVRQVIMWCFQVGER